jgi:hypothetical protein
MTVMHLPKYYFLHGIDEFLNMALVFMLQFDLSVDGNMIHRYVVIYPKEDITAQ